MLFGGNEVEGADAFAKDASSIITPIRGSTFRCRPDSKKKKNVRMPEILPHNSILAEFLYIYKYKGRRIPLTL